MEINITYKVKIVDCSNFIQCSDISTLKELELGHSSKYEENTPVVDFISDNPVNWVMILH